MLGRWSGRGSLRVAEAPFNGGAGSQSWTSASSTGPPAEIGHFVMWSCRPAWQAVDANAGHRQEPTGVSGCLDQPSRRPSRCWWSRQQRWHLAAASVRTATARAVSDPRGDRARHGSFCASPRKHLARQALTFDCRPPQFRGERDRVDLPEKYHRAALDTESIIMELVSRPSSNVALPAK